MDRWMDEWVDGLMGGFSKKILKKLEKIFHNRMMYFIEEKNILHERQYGFRKNMSTSLTIL